jgi:hypothetical protein
VKTVGNEITSNVQVWNNRLGKLSCRRKEEQGKELGRRSFGKREMEGEAWLPED